MTDGGMMFPIIAAVARTLQLARELPRMIFVGIGYPPEDEAQKPSAGAPAHNELMLRARDLTPTEVADYGVDPASGAARRTAGTGGADAFLDFIERQVKPLINSRFDVDQNDQTLVGDSLGGLFTLHTMLTRPSSFQRFLAGSPSLWWDEEKLFTTEQQYAQTHTDLPAHLFLSVGALEEGQRPADAPFRMVTNTHKMAAQLSSRDYSGLRMTTHEFPGETHVSVVAATLSRGLRELFAPEG